MNTPYLISLSRHFRPSITLSLGPSVTSAALRIYRITLTPFICTENSATDRFPDPVFLKVLHTC